MKLLLVCDVKGWAFDHTAHALKRWMPDHEVSICYDTQLGGINMKNYDHIHFMNWLDGQVVSSRITAGVCQHNFEIKWRQIAEREIPKLKRVIAISRILEEKVKKLNPRTYYCPNGADDDVFTPDGPPKRQPEFTVGWVGQRTDGRFGKKRNKEGRKIYDIKGCELLLQPLMERMKGKVKFKVVNNDHTNAIPYKDMPKIYQDIDFFLCTSIFEGGPMPAIEAAACGKPIIGTKVGILPEMVMENITGLLVDAPAGEGDIERTLQQLEAALLKAKACTDEEYKNSCIAIRAEVEARWSWKKVIKKYWEPFFKGTYER